MTTGERSTEARIEQLVEIEQELKRDPLEDEARGVYERGHIAGAERIPAAEIPEDHPVTVDSEQALRIDVATDGGIVETYIEWAPHQGEEGHIDLLLNALGRGPEEFANIFGDEVALTYQDGYHGIDAEATAKMRRTGIPDLGIDLSFLPTFSVPHSGVIVAGLVGVLAITAQLLWLDSTATATLSIWLLASITLPFAIAIDASRMTRETSWRPITVAWMVAAFIPFINIPISVTYLIKRHVKLGSHSGRVPLTWLYAIGLLGLAYLPVIALFFVSVDKYSFLWLTVIILLPLAVFFDFEYVDTQSRKTLKRVVWTVVTAALSVFFLGFLAAGAYLVYRFR